MAVPTGDQGIGAALPRFLAQTGEGVILGQNADDGPSLPEAAAEGGVDITQLLRHLKAQRTEGIAVELCGPEFFQGQFGIVPYLVGKGRKCAGLFIHRLKGGFFLFIHS